MKKSVVIIAVLALALVLPSAATAQEGPYPPYAPGMGGGMGTGYMGMMGFGQGVMGYGLGMMDGGADMMGPVGPYGMLDLSAEQTTKINKILDSLRRQHLGVLGKMMDEQAKMRDLFYEEKLDAKKIGTVHDAISALRKQLLIARVEAMNDIREILTKEQREDLIKYFRGRRAGVGDRPRHGRPER